MAKDSVAAYGAKGEGNKSVLMDPKDLIIATDPAHPLYDKRCDLPISEKVVRTIMRKGVQKAITIWKDPESGKIYVVDGRQRTKANVEANKRLVKAGEEPKWIPCIAKRASDPRMLLDLMAIHNTGAQDVTIAWRADLALRMQQAGYADEQIMESLHIDSAATLKNYLAFLDCRASVRKAVEEERLPITIAYRLAKKSPEEQEVELEKLLKAAGDSKGRARGKKMREASGDVPMRTRKIITGFHERLTSLVKADKQHSPNLETVLAVLDWIMGKPLKGEFATLESPEKAEKASKKAAKAKDEAAKKTEEVECVPAGKITRAKAKDKDSKPASADAAS